MVLFAQHIAFDVLVEAGNFRFYGSDFRRTFCDEVVFLICGQSTKSAVTSHQCHQQRHFSRVVYCQVYLLNRGNQWFVEVYSGQRLLQVRFVMVIDQRKGQLTLA